MHLASLPSQYLIRNSPQKASITVSPFCQINSRLSPLCRLGQSQLSKFKYVIWSCLLGLVPLGNEKLIFFSHTEIFRCTLTHSWPWQQTPKFNDKIQPDVHVSARSNTASVCIWTSTSKTWLWSFAANPAWWVQPVLGGEYKLPDGCLRKNEALWPCALAFWWLHCGHLFPWL